MKHPGHVNLFLKIFKLYLLNKEEKIFITLNLSIKIMFIFLKKLGIDYFLKLSLMRTEYLSEKFINDTIINKLKIFSIWQKIY